MATNRVIEIETLSKCLPTWFINEYKKLLALIDVKPHQSDAAATPATFMDLFNTLAGMKSSTEAVSLTYHVMIGLGWTENMSDIEPLADGRFSLQRGYPAIHDRITRLGLKDMKRAIDDIVLKISDNLHDYHNRRCRLALVGLLGLEQIDRNRTTLCEMFALVVQMLDGCYSKSAALICQILKRLSWNSKELERYASPVYVMERDHPEIDLRLTVVGYYDNMGDSDYRNSRLLTSRHHLGGMNVSNKDKDEFVQLLCEKNIIKVGDVSNLDDRYNYFQQYNERCRVRQDDLPSVPTTTAETETNEQPNTTTELSEYMSSMVITGTSRNNRAMTNNVVANDGHNPPTSTPSTTEGIFADDIQATPRH